MAYSSTDTYKMKKEIIKLSKRNPCRYFAPDKNLGLICLWADGFSKLSADKNSVMALQKREKKIYAVDWLSYHLKARIDSAMLSNSMKLKKWCQMLQSSILSCSDVVKPEEASWNCKWVL